MSDKYISANVPNIKMIELGKGLRSRGSSRANW